MTMYNHESEEPVEVVSIQQWLKDPNLLHSFKCNEVKVNGYLYERQAFFLGQITSFYEPLEEDVPYSGQQ